jgi:hypothetical protein
MNHFDPEPAQPSLGLIVRRRVVSVLLTIPILCLIASVNVIVTPLFHPAAEQKRYEAERETRETAAEQKSYEVAREALASAASVQAANAQYERVGRQRAQSSSLTDGK